MNHVVQAESDSRQISVGGQQFSVMASHYPAFWDKVNAGTWERDTFAVLDSLLSESTRYIDCGAWIGPTVLYAAAKGAQVTAFECDPVALELLKENLALNPALAERVILIEAALSDRDALIVLNMARPGDSQSSLFGVVERRGERQTLARRTIVQGLDTRRVFDEAGWLKAPDVLVKIDIAGAEYTVLQTLGLAIAKAACRFYITFHPLNLVSNDERPEKLLRAQATLAWMDLFWNYTWQTGASGTLEHVDKERYLELGLSGKPLPSILFSPSSDAESTTVANEESLPQSGSQPEDAFWSKLLPTAVPQNGASTHPRSAGTQRISVPPATSPAELLQREIPIFVIAFNNPTYVENMVKQLQARGLHNIVVIDNASTSDEMIPILSGKLDITVVRQKRNQGPRLLIEDENYFLLPELFVVTDPDLELNPKLPPDFLAKLVRLTEHYQIGKAGFALDISDPSTMIQEVFTFGNRKRKIWEREEGFWKNPIGDLDGLGTVYKAPIDTTFAVYNKKYFRQDNRRAAVRVAGVFTCRHLPWYIGNGLSAAEEEAYRATTRISHYLPRRATNPSE